MPCPCATTAATCYVLLADLALNFLRSLVSKQWQEAAGWAASAAAAAVAQRAADGIAALARLHDAYLLCRDPVVALKTGATLWALAVLGSFLRWGLRPAGAGRADACPDLSRPAGHTHREAPVALLPSTISALSLQLVCPMTTSPAPLHPSPPTRSHTHTPHICSLWSLAALAFVAAFTLPAAYSRHREAVKAAYQRAMGAAAARWNALGLSRKQKVRPAGQAEGTTAAHGACPRAR